MYTRGLLVASLASLAWYASPPAGEAIFIGFLAGYLAMDARTLDSLKAELSEWISFVALKSKELTDELSRKIRK